MALQKPERTLQLGGTQQGSAPTFSQNGKALAVAWQPKRDPKPGTTSDSDPEEFGQPRVTLFNLVGDTPPRVLIAPRGHVGRLAFSPDGRVLAFGSAGAVHLFDLTK
jgi:WD40 repeat protein